MQNLFRRQWCRWAPVVGLISLVAGCGSGGGGSAPPSTGPGATTPVASKASLTRFDVNTQTGKVTLSPVDASGRAIFAGNAVSFTSSDLLTVPGDAGNRLLQISVSNLSGQTLGSNARVVVGNLTNNAAVNIRSQVTVTTLAGTGALGSTDGSSAIATFHTPNGVLVDSTGTQIYVADTINDTVRLLGNDGFTSTFAGLAPVSGLTDGTGGAARFSQPDQLARDAQGNLFIADLGNNAIRRITPLGEVSTIAGTGTAGNSNGSTGTNATFNQPQGIAVSADGNRIYLTETNDIRLITYTTGPRNISSSYTVTTVAGSATAGYLDSLTGQPPLFNHPYHLTLASDNAGVETLFVTDLNNAAVRRIDTPTGVPYVSTIAGGNGQGSTDGPGSAARFNQPKGIAAVTNAQGATTLFLTEANHQLRMITLQGSELTQKGSYLVQTLAGNGFVGFADGDGTVARFHDPAGVTALPISGNSATLYIADANNNRIRKVVVASGALSSGNGSGNGTVSETVRLLNADSEIPNQTAWAKNLNTQTGDPVELQFFVPSGVSSFSFTAYVEADTNLINLPASGAAYVSTLAGDGQAGLFNGPGKLAEFAQPTGIASSNGTTALGNYRAFVAERFNRLIRAIDFNGNVTTLAGGGTNQGDGLASQAAFSDPFGIAVGPDGSIYFTDLNGARVRRIAKVGTTLTVGTIAGGGTATSQDGPGNTVALSQPAGIAVDRGGTIYITDTAANTVRKITYINGDPMAASSYTVNTIAGVYQSSGSSDGASTSARFNHPLGITVDTDGKVYVCDGGNNTIRALTRTGFNSVNVTTLAGVAGTTGEVDGTGSAARFNLPAGITLDTAHNLYTSDFGGSRIRRISPQGAVVSLAGTGSGMVDGANASFNGPYMVSLEPAGNLLVVDYNNNALRVVQRIVSDGQSSISSRPTRKALSTAPTQKARR